MVSFVPSATETLSAWRVEPVACTRFCERPDLPHAKDPDVSAIVALEPDLVVVERGRYPSVELADVRALRPDVVLAPSEPYPFRARHLAELSAVAPAHLVDGQDLFWWGVRTGGALERLAAQLDGLVSR